MKTLIYDCEIINCIPSKYEENDKTLTYCKGWGDFEGMGISVIGTWRNFNTLNPFGKYEAFVNPENPYQYTRLGEMTCFKKLETLAQKADRIIGFNSLSFDDKLVEAERISIKSNFDLLVKIRKATGQGDGTYQYGVTRSGYASQGFSPCQSQIQ
jgi:hypothetical protein